MKRTFRLAFMFVLAIAALPFTSQASDEECENACFQQYFECAMGCSACDACSCQLAYCRAGCGVPFTGC